MRNIFLHIFMWICVAFSYASAFTPTDNEQNQDSLYNSVVRDGSLRLDCYFTYAPNSADIQEHLDSNIEEFNKLDAFIRTALNDKRLAIKRIRLSGYSSIDGNYITNNNLARERVWAFRNYLSSYYTSLRPYPVDVAWVAEDWDLLKILLRNTNSPYKSELLYIITHVDSSQSRKKQLMNLRGGVPYEWMKKELFPLMRRVEMIVDFETVDPSTATKRDGHYIDPLIYNVLEEKDEIQVPNRGFSGLYPWEEKGVYDYSPRWAIRTNLLLWAGIMSDAKRTTYTPNLSLEYYLTDHWSIEAGAQYTNWHYDSDRQFYGLTGYRLEPRYWLKLPNQKYFMYLGAYGRFGDYNMREEEYNGQLGANATGKYWDAGLSAGLYLHLTNHWGIEVGARAGYVRTESKLYTIENGHRYLDGYELYDKVRVTDLMLNVVYRWR